MPLGVVMNHLCLITNESKESVREFIDFHKQHFNLIHIYNNGKALFQFDDVFEYDVRTLESPQLKCYNDCFAKLSYGDTLTCLDTDERLILEQDLNSLFRMFPMFDVLQYSWQCMTDNGLTTKDSNKTLMEQFTEIAPMNCVFNTDLPNNITENYHHKFTVRKSWKPTTIDIHTAHVKNGIAFDMNGAIVNIDSPWSKPIWSRAFVRHFLSQDTETFCKRRFNVKDACGNVVADTNKLIDRYYNLNKRTKEKDDIFKRYSKDLQPVPSQCHNDRISDGTQPTGSKTTGGESKQTNGTIHKRAGTGEKQ